MDNLPQLNEKLLSRVIPFLKFLKPLQNLLTNPLDWLKKLPELLGKVKELPAKIKEFITKLPETLKKLIFEPIKGKEDYVAVGNRYVAKKLLTGLAALGVALYYLIFVNPPEFIDRWLGRYTHLVVATEKAQQFTGKAELYESDDTTLRYKGQMANGQYDGEGTLYRYSETEGLYVYQGTFKDNVFSGTGELRTSQDNTLVYRGGFLAGAYSGQGIRYNDEGKVQYVGTFENGLLSGTGSQYDPATGFLLYEGTFKNNLLEGTGKSFYQNTDKLQYEGGFSKGQRSGTGTLYFQNGAIQYKGEFAENVPHGTVEEYTDNGQLHYKGQFQKGLRQGSGELYDDKGIVYYKGTFLQDKAFYPAFLGMTGTDLKTLIGDPAAVTAAGDAKPPQQSWLTYNNYQINFLTQVNKNNPNDVVVSQLKVFGQSGLAQIEDLVTLPAFKEQPNTSDSATANNPKTSLKSVKIYTSDQYNTKITIEYENDVLQLATVDFLNS